MNKKNLIIPLAFYFLINYTTPCNAQEKNENFYNKINLIEILKKPLFVSDLVKDKTLPEIINNANEFHDKCIEKLNKPYSDFIEIKEIYPKFRFNKNFGINYSSHIDYNYKSRMIKFGLRLEF